MVRTPCCEKMGMKKGPWTPEEDHILVSYIQHYGHENWRALPKQAGLLRCGKSCRLRWINYLRPDIKRGNFTQEEEETIIRLHQLLGNRWAAIAAKLPGRTDNEIKNFWHTHLKKKLLRTAINTSTPNNLTSYHKPYSNYSIGSLSKYPINNPIVNVTSAVSEEEEEEDHEEPSKMDVDHRFQVSLSSGSSTLMAYNHNNGVNNHHESNNSSKKIDEEMEFWYNLFVKSSGEPSCVLVSGDHSS